MSSVSDRLQYKITKLYLDMRLKRISRLNWMIETEEAIEALKQTEHSDIIPELFYIQLLITKEAYEAAESLLDQAADWLRIHSQEAPVCHAYYLYLTTLMGEDEVLDRRVAGKLTELSGKHPSIWQIQWLLYYVDSNLAGQAAEQYHFLKRMFIKGCRSPLMYLEARVLLERNPTFLYEFSEFEVQLIMFMIRHAGMSQRVAEILAEFMLKRTDFRYLYVLFLQGCYEVNPSKRILESICKMMILGGCAGERFSLWYRKGMAENVRIPGLYEAFMRSLPVEEWYLDGEELSDNRRIPTEAVEYFAHAAGLDRVRTAYLYALVHKYRDNWFSLYKLYEPLMQPFMMDSLFKGQINAGLAYLYTYLLDMGKLPKERIEGFLELCYTHRITALPIQAGTLIIRYRNLKEAVRIPFTGTEATAALYGTNYTLAVENYSGSEIGADQAVRIPYLEKEHWQEFFACQEVTNLYYHLAQTEAALDTKTLDKAVHHIKKIFSAEAVAQDFKEKVATQILPYWDINGIYEEILAAAPFVFTEYGTYSKAAETAFWKQQYMLNHIGIYGVQFLLEHYEGTLQERGGIFMKADSLGIETGAFAEQLLHDMLEEGQLLPQHVAVMEACSRSTDNPDLIRGYLEFAAERDYPEQRLCETALLKQQAALTLNGVSFRTIAKLYFLQSLSAVGAGSFGRELSDVAVQYLEELLEEGIYMSWMQPLKVLYAKLSDWEAYQVLEYRGQFAGPVWVRYTLYTEGKEEAESLRSEVMDGICEGVYIKKCILFYGERIYYEIFGLEGTEQRQLGQGVLQGGGAFSQGSNSKFARLNRMLSLREKRENWELYQELEQYYGQSAVVDRLFQLK